MPKRSVVLFAGALALILLGCDALPPTAQAPAVRPAPVIAPASPHRTTPARATPAQPPAPATNPYDQFPAGGGGSGGGGSGGGGWG